MKYLSAKEVAENWDISQNRVLELARKGRIAGAQFVGNSWIFPETAEKPSDGRRIQTENAKCPPPRKEL